MDDLERQRELRLMRDEIMSTPNCLHCLHRMEAAERDGEAVWRCTSCGAELD